MKRGGQLNPVIQSTEHPRYVKAPTQGTFITNRQLQDPPPLLANEDPFHPQTLCIKHIMNFSEANVCWEELRIYKQRLLCCHREDNFPFPLIKTQHINKPPCVITRKTLQVTGCSTSNTNFAAISRRVFSTSSTAAEAALISTEHSYVSRSSLL